MNRYRALFISDLHLGSQTPEMVGRLLLFLEHHSADRLYLVGDVVNGKKERVPSEAIRALLGAAAKVRYVYGNHDFLGTLGGLVSVDHVFHETVDHRRLLVTHGDKFDPLMDGWWVVFHALPFFHGYVYRNFVSRSKRVALDQGCQGVVCGHLHHPEIHQQRGFLYINTGDFVTSFTAVAEHMDGRFELLYG
jgi:UDP-2,3-diacylglucosamine pyrophosphatase LpxH